MITDDFNCARYIAGQRRGHYESYFVRANHPTKPHAFWIRYTIFSPDRRPAGAVGELWAVVFDGVGGRHVATKLEVPIGQCSFSRERLDVRVAGATLGPDGLSGSAGSGRNEIGWDLTYSGGGSPVFDFPLDRYDSGFPRAKVLVGAPMVRFAGVITLNGDVLAIDDWVGSQNHNWGSRHTDRYAWGQVCGFDNAPDSFVEAASAQVRLGPLWSPMITLVVVRHAGKEYQLNSFVGGMNAKASYDDFAWRFATRQRGVRIEGALSAPREAFVGLRYRNPPGGTKLCLNTKIAACTLRITHAGSGRTETLETASRAAFEILRDDAGSGAVLGAPVASCSQSA